MHVSRHLQRLSIIALLLVFQFVMSLTSFNVLNWLIGFGLAGMVGWVSQHIALGAILYIAKCSYKTRHLTCKASDIIDQGLFFRVDNA